MSSLFIELRRRNVFKAGAAYAIVAWLLIQIADIVFPTFGAPEWVLKVFTFFVFVGLPITLVMAWAYEMTPEGIKKTESVSLSESITGVTGRKLDFVIIGLMAIGIVFLLVDRYVLVEVPAPAPAPAPATAAQNQPLESGSIAVLPFANRSAREEDQFFVDGIHDDILTQLARVSSIKVISRTSVMGYRDTEKNMRTIGEELGVTTLLEGGVQRSGDSVRINVQLIDAATDGHLWAEIYDRTLTVENVFAIQSEMATAIASALEASLSPEEVARINAVPTQNTRAYDFYLSGNDYFNRPADVTFKPLAVEMYERAVAEDPEFALAWAALSRAHSSVHWYGVDRTPMRLEAAEQAVQRALAIAPDLPEAHLALGFYYDLGFRDYARAQQEYTIAEQALPDDSYLIELTAYMQRRMGDYPAAVATFERLLARDPRNPDLLSQLANTLTGTGDYSAAQIYFERALQIAPDSSPAYLWLADIPVYRDGDVSILKAVAERPAMPIGEWREYNGWLAAIYERDYDTALAYIDRLETVAITFQLAYYPVPLLRGIAHQLAGRAELAEPAFQAARANVEAALAENPEDPRLHIALAQTLTGLGEFEAAEITAREALALMPRSKDDLSGRWHKVNAIIGVFAPSGNVEATVEELDAHLSAGSYWSIEGLLPNPRFDPVRDDPRFQALVERYRRQ